MGLLQDRSKRPFIAGLAGTLVMAAFFAAVLTLVRGPSHVLSQFAANWYWMLPLIAAFGVQSGVFVWVRDSLAEVHGGASAEMAASGGMSAASMVACCVHHVADLLPALGIGALGTLLGAYQGPLGVLAIGSNVFGIVMMLGSAQRHGVLPGSAPMRWLFRAVDLQVLRIVVGLLAVSATMGAVWFVASARETASAGAEASGGTAASTPEAGGKALEPRTDERGGLAVVALPSISPDRGVAVQLQFDVHEGSLEFDVAKAAVLKDQTGREYKPNDWQGDPPGGHHREGVLSFPRLDKDASRMTLELRGIWADGALRSLSWDLP